MIPDNLFSSSAPKFLRKQENAFAQSFSEFSKSLTLIVDLEQLKNNVIANIREIARVESICIFLLSQDLNRFEVVESRGNMSPDNHQFYLYPGDPLIRWFTVNESHLLLPENPQIFTFFAEREQHFLEQAGIELIFPLMAMNRITGLICMSSKISGQPFTGNEIEMLSTMLGQAALAFENAYLYQQQKVRLKKMYRADRLATLGQLAAGAAHEIRNPLTSIRSTIQYIEKNISKDDDRAMMQDLIEEVDRINDIIEGLLSFSRPTQPQMQNTDLRALLEQTIALLQPTMQKQDIAFDFTWHPEATHLHADPSQLKQVFLNICMNALEAMPDGGEIRITVHHQVNTTQPANSNRDTFAIMFEDTGPGISEGDLEHIFDPFFTTKKEGTGLGLSISYGIIRQHDGEIDISSQTTGDTTRRGTRVVVKLPASR